MSLYGTEASYEEQCGNQKWVTKVRDACEDITEMLQCRDMDSAHKDGLMSNITSADGTHRGVSGVHPVHRLPRDFDGMRNGHKGSHQFLVHDFVTACISGKLPPNNVWDAARYLIPGLIAHESALKGGQLMEVPDFGDAPCGMEPVGGMMNWQSQFGRMFAVRRTMNHPAQVWKHHEMMLGLSKSCVAIFR